jgi:GNAT superfamily N-acetyltransferase
MFTSFLTIKYQTDLQEFAIAPSYQSQGVGKVLLRHVVALAERDRLSLALTAGHGGLPCELFNSSLLTILLSHLSSETGLLHEVWVQSGR